MPEPPIFSKRKPVSLSKEERSRLVQRSRNRLRYAELHCRTNFSFLEGASHADELATQAAASGYEAIAITDVASLAGVVKAHVAAKDSGLKLIIGAEVAPTDGARLVLWATDRASYGRLSRLLTVGRRRAEKGKCELTVADVAEYGAGLLAGVVPERDVPLVAPPSIHEYRDVFGDRLWLLAELHYGVNDVRRLTELQQLSRDVRVPLVAAGDVHYHVRRRMALQHVLTAIRHNTTVAELGDRCLPNAERHLRDLDEIRTVFREAPDALRRTVEIAERCQFSLDELRFEYPVELAPPGETPMAYLRRLTWEEGSRRYKGEIPEEVSKQLAKELELIEKKQYEAFFLTVYDAVKFARSRDILCQGRGSAANSAVCFALGVTAVDPTEHKMLFERFISAERDEAPDIDVDFEHERREEVLQYLYEKYGRERAGLAATVITYRVRSAVRDVAKALGVPAAQVDELAKNVDSRSEDVLDARRCEQSSIDSQARFGRQLRYLVEELVGFPRHLSQHVGGMVIAERSLCELAPIENAAMADRTVIQWDKDDLDELGILKVDCLALGMLTAIRKCFDLIEKSTSQRFTIASIPDNDRDVYEMIGHADTIGVFQIESRAQMSMLPRLKPREFYDLVIEVAIVRPGPIQGKMVHPYLRRRDGSEEPDYPNDEVRAVLERTLGVPLFQEQAMQLAVVAAGFEPGEADQLRRAMGAWRREGLINQYRKKLIDGMLRKGYAIEFAERLFQQISGFGEYGFPESHAASFAKLVYVSAWLKYHYPAAFAAALINSQPMGFYAPAQLICDARNHGVEVLPIDVNASDWDCTLEERGERSEVRGQGEEIKSRSGPALRLGMRLIGGFSESAARAIAAAREAGPFRSVEELAKRASLGRRALKLLADADAFGSLRLDRRAALWEALDQNARSGDLSLFAAADGDGESSEKNPFDEIPPLPPLTPQEVVTADYRTAKLSLRAHPVSFLREHLDRLKVTPAGRLAELPHGSLVKVAGLVLNRQRPATASGITFVTLEDETGIANLIVRLATWQRYELVARRAASFIASGRLERQGEVIHIVVRRIEELDRSLANLGTHSRDFH